MLHKKEHNEIELSFTEYNSIKINQIFLTDTVQGHTHVHKQNLYT